MIDIEVKHMLFVRQLLAI